MFSIFKTFFLLGWVSFGGPAAHIGYFRQTFVTKYKWLSDEEYGQLIALSQFLPGPGSSQVGFALGYKRAGLQGAIAAFVGFTLPSVIIMLALAITSSALVNNSIFESIVHGLKLLAVLVVADATWGMFKNFCKDTKTVFLCIATACVLLVSPTLSTQFAVLISAALIGAVALKGKIPTTHQQEFKPSLIPLLLFIVLLLGLPLTASLAPEISLFNDFYQAGSLVFGGGHVVLPLLQNIVGDQLSQDAFITGYAAAQAVPGPMFTFATYIGYELFDNAPIIGALSATLAVFLPGFLLLLTVLKDWQVLANKPSVSGALAGVNAAVVGLLIAALYTPIFTSAVSAPKDIALVLIGFLIMKQLKLPIIWLVVSFMLGGLALSAI
ncbi:putative chromate transport protein [Pseudoalteromonas sp. P1-9]|uniref:chromate efflux transporter n=1 Tax=Pseudoalteromonas sp. P1-9 TaxID=1710354 RepID=UPI0006D5F68D|nr:chromate efflux transporter [Pseudoalteromonas sp. P1-9]KPV96315.1 putative chromate transport protein [Pseudoalteromonas sp. P1-9]